MFDMSDSEYQEQEFSFKSFFVPLTTLKAIHIIVILGVIVFFNGLFNGFVSDDQLQIIDNPIVHSLQNLPSFFSGSTFYQGNQQHSVGYYYRPLLSTSYAMTYSFFGASAFAYHLFQIFLYISNACIVFLVFKHFFRKSIALLLSIIFLVHPLNSEVALYVADTQEVLFFFFGILSLWILHKQQSKKTLFLIGLLLFCSLLVKESAVLFICMAFAYLFILKRKNYYVFLGYVSLFLIMYFILRMKAINIFTHWAPNAPIEKLDFLGRMINMPSIFLFYIKSFLFPLNLSSSYLWVNTHVNFNNFIFPLILDFCFIVVVISFAVLLFRKYSRTYFRIYIFFGLWFFVGMLFHLQMLPLDQTVAERWFYFPMVGILGMSGVIFEIFHKKILSKKVIVFIALIIVLLSYRTFLRTFDWRDNLTLAIHDSETFKESYDLENKIGTELLKQGRFQEAKNHLEKSVELYPSVQNYSNLGITYANLREYKKATEVFKKALTLGDNYMVYENIASLYVLTENDASQTIHFIKAALEKYPQDPKLWEYLAVVEYKNKNIAEAKVAINTAYTYNKNSEISNLQYLIMNNQPLNLKYNTK